MYEDETVYIDSGGVLIRNYYAKGRDKAIALDAIRGVRTFSMGPLSGRWRVIGLGPAKLRNWFAWDTRRRSKATAVSLDVGKWIRPTFAPTDPDAAKAAIDEASGTR